MATRRADGSAASGHPGGSARPEHSGASSSSGAAEHTGGATDHNVQPRGSVNNDEFLEGCSDACSITTTCSLATRAATTTTAADAGAEIAADAGDAANHLADAIRRLN